MARPVSQGHDSNQMSERAEIAAIVAYGDGPFVFIGAGKPDETLGIGGRTPAAGTSCSRDFWRRCRNCIA